MVQRSSSVKDTAQRAEHAVRQAAANPWVERLARFGYAAKGVVYIVVGVLAAMTALGFGGQTTNSRGALRTILTQPFGKVLLGLVAVGLIGYALWRFVQAGLDPERKRDDGDLKRIGLRIAYAISGVVYVGLAFTAIQLVRGAERGRGGGGNASQDWTARILSQPFGRWLIGIVGLIIIGVGIFQIYKGYTAKFREKLKLNEMSSTEQTWATRSGKFGFPARGVVFGVIGIFLVQAALKYDPSKAQGLEGALDALARQPFGWIILAVVALGLAAYGIFMLVQARYRHIVTS